MKPTVPELTEASETRPDAGRQPQQVGEARLRLEPADGDARRAAADGEPRPGRGQVERLTAARVEPGAKFEAAAERRAGEPRPGRQIGYPPGDRAANQPGVEPDPQAALDRAARGGQADAGKDQLGRPIGFGRERQRPVEPGSAEAGVDRALPPGEVGDLRVEPQPVDPGAGGGDVASFDPAREPKPVDRAVELYLRRERSRRRQAERRAERRQSRQIEVEGRREALRGGVEIPRARQPRRFA